MSSLQHPLQGRKRGEVVSVLSMRPSTRTFASSEGGAGSGAGWVEQLQKLLGRAAKTQGLISRLLSASSLCTRFSILTPGRSRAFGLCVQGFGHLSQGMALACVLYLILGSLCTAQHLPF